MDADRLINTLGREMGVPTLHFDNSHCARLLFDGTLAVDLEYDPEKRAIHVYCVLAELPSRGREALYAMLLEGNLFGRETAAATLAVDTEQKEIVLCRTVPTDTATLPAFKEQLEGFVNAAEHWQERIAAAAAGGATGFAEPPRMDQFLRG